MSDLKLIRGDSDLLECEITDDDGEAYGLSDYVDKEITFTVRRSESGPEVLKKQMSKGEISIVDPPGDGKINIQMEAGDTDKMKNYYLYDIELDDGTPKGRHTIRPAVLEIEPDISFSDDE